MSIRTGAERWAVEFLRSRLRAIDEFDGPAAVTRVHVERVTHALVDCNEGPLDNLLVEARRDAAAFDACVDVLEWLAKHNMPTPPTLAAFFREVAHGRRKRPPEGRHHKRHGNLHRNVLIDLCVQEIARKFKLAKSGSGSRNTTAADVVSTALYECGIHLSSEGVKEACKNTQ